MEYLKYGFLEWQIVIKPELRLHSNENNDCNRTMCWDTDFKKQHIKAFFF